MTTAIHRGKGRQFKPTLRGGGSKKGKPQGTWPIAVRAWADAILARAKGSELDAWIADRRQIMTLTEFRSAMGILMPGFWLLAEKHMPGRKTDLGRLLINRVYKMNYSGTSDRKKQPHDPNTRAMTSREHWRYKLADSDPIVKIREGIVSGRIQKIPDWKRYVGWE